MKRPKGPRRGEQSYSEGIFMKRLAVPIGVGLALLCLLLLLSIPCRRKLWFLLKTLVELGIVFAVSSVLSFGYTGTVLLIIADTMSYFPDRKQRILFVAGIFAAYLLMDYDLLSARYSIISLEISIFDWN